MRLQSLSMFAALTITACSTGAPQVDPDPDQNPPVETGPRYITLDHDALATAQDALAQRDPNAKLDMIDMWNGVALVRFDAQDRPRSIADVEQAVGTERQPAGHPEIAGVNRGAAIRRDAA